MATILTKIASLESSWLITIVIALFTLLLAKFWFKIKSYPPGPFPLPFIGNILRFRTEEHPLHVINRLRKKYGDIFTIWLGSEPVVIICNWILAKEALIAKPRDFAGRQKRIISEIHSGGHTNVVFGDFGPKWENLRKITVIAIRKYVMSEKFRESVCNATDEMIQRMLNEKQPVNPKEHAFFALQNIIAEAAFGQRYQEHEREYAELKETSTVFFNEFSLGLPSDVLRFLRPFYWRREQYLRKCTNQLRNIILKKYRDHMESYQSGKIRDFTDAVIAARKEAEKEDIAQLTDYNFHNIIVDLFIGGIHTTLTSILWMLIFLGNYEDVQKKMVAEIDDVIGSSIPTQEDKVKCPYSSAVIMEAQRFKTIAPLGLDHRTTCDSELGGYPIKKDTTLVINQLAMHSDPKNWPEPMEFKPERFLEDDALSKLRKDGYIPFSAGRRMCTGEKFAITEIFLTIVRVLQQCKITLPNGPGTADLGLTEQVLFCGPKPFQICVQQRKDLVA